ncbi:MAG: hypothetical protein ACK52I_16950 [Pseudomonadota bacterium]
MNLNGINQPTKRLGRRKAGRWIGQRNLEGFDPAAVELGQARMEDRHRLWVILSCDLDRQLL